MSRFKKLIYFWFLRHKMCVYMKNDRLCYSGIWSEEHRRIDYPLVGLGLETIGPLEKYVVNK